MRFIGYIILAIVAISALRGVIGLVASIFTNATVGPERTAGAPKAPGPEALKKDPVCGTFVAPSAAVRLDKAGQTYFFCSTACRDKFAGLA